MCTRGCRLQLKGEVIFPLLFRSLYKVPALVTDLKVLTENSDASRTVRPTVALSSHFPRVTQNPDISVKFPNCSMLANNSDILRMMTA